ncbi:MAG: histone deacetylase [Bacteroidota bacterium]
MLRIFHSDRFVPQLPAGHRFPIDKYGLIREQLLYEGSVDAHMLVESEPIAEEHILALHTPQYWEAVKKLEVLPRAMRKIGFPQSSSLVDRSRRSVNGTFESALWALKHGIGMNIAGGTHHAYRERGEGFCLLNDIAISATYLLKQKWVKQILIVDLDVHQGNGNAYIFQSEPAVFTFSMHGKDNYPLHKEISDLDIALATDTGDQAYLDTLSQQLPDLIQQLKPDLIYFQAGVDILETDRLGKLSLSREACKERDKRVLQLCRNSDVPVVICIGGGYSEKISDTVEAHSNTFRQAISLFA